MSKAGIGYRFANSEYDRSLNTTKGRLIGKLYARFDDGEGDVTLSFEVDNESAMWRVDVLGDIIELLKTEQLDAYNEMIWEFEHCRESKGHDLERVG